MEIESFEDIEKFRLSTGASSVMLARQAQWNCSIFRPEGIFNVCDVIRSYISYVSLLCFTLLSVRSCSHFYMCCMHFITIVMYN